jgi:signal peptidase II
MLTVLISNISCDQISKNIARHKLDYHEQISVADKYLTLIKVENTGAFLGLGQSLPQPVKVLLLTVLPLFALGLAILYSMTRRNLTSMTQTGISFVVGGGIGNIYDRIVYGSVTDFLHIDFVIFKTGIFNMADVSVMTGAMLILMGSQFSRSKVSPEAGHEDL